MSLKVLHVLDHSIPLHSGYAFRTLSILIQQRRLGWETCHLTSTRQEGARLPVESVDGFDFHRTLATGSILRKIPVASALEVIWDTRKRVLQLAAELRPDIIHAHSPCLVGIGAMLAARKLGVPFVYELRALWEDAAVDHGTTTEDSLRYRLSRGAETWLLRRTGAITTICQGLLDDIVGRGIPVEKITVIPNAVDAEGFPVIANADAQLQAQLGLQGATVLGFLGSFYGYEGLDTLLDALPLILRSHPQVRVLLVGGGYEEQRLREQAQRLGVADKVVFAGRVPHAEVNRYYSVVDLLVYPRKSMRLTNTVTPLKPLEAMAQGRMLAASDVGGHRELIDNRRTGYLFKPDDSQDLAVCVNRILTSPGEWAALRAAGRSFVEAERTWASSVARYRQVYSSLLHRSV